MRLTYAQGRLSGRNRSQGAKTTGRAEILGLCPDIMDPKTTWYYYNTYTGDFLGKSKNMLKRPGDILISLKFESELNSKHASDISIFERYNMLVACHTKMSQDPNSVIERTLAAASTHPLEDADNLDKYFFVPEEFNSLLPNARDSLRPTICIAWINDFMDGHTQSHILWVDEKNEPTLWTNAEYLATAHRKNSKSKLKIFAQEEIIPLLFKVPTAEELERDYKAVAEYQQGLTNVLKTMSAKNSAQLGAFAI